VEGTHTFTGQSKPLYLKENKLLFKKYDKKIIPVVVDDFPYKDNITSEQVWENIS
jgi:hypothetical protein